MIENFHPANIISLASTGAYSRPMQPAMLILASVLAMSGIIAVRYLLSSGGFALATRLTRPGLYAGMRRQIGGEIRWSLLSALIFGLPAGLVAWGWQNRGWTQIYTDLNAWPLWYLPASVLLYLAAHDTWFYWTHRLMHRPALFRVAHAVHHASASHHQKHHEQYRCNYGLYFRVWDRLCGTDKGLSNGFAVPASAASSPALALNGSAASAKDAAA